MITKLFISVCVLLAGAQAQSAEATFDCNAMSEKASFIQDVCKASFENRDLTYISILFPPSLPSGQGWQSKGNDWVEYVKKHDPQYVNPISQKLVILGQAEQRQADAFHQKLRDQEDRYNSYYEQLSVALRSPDGWKLCQAAAQAACNEILYNKARGQKTYLKSNLELLIFVANHFNPGMEKQLLKVEAGEFLKLVAPLEKDWAQISIDYQPQYNRTKDEGRSLIRQFILEAEGRLVPRKS